MSATIPAEKFKEKCLKLLDEVNETHHAVVITKFGKPIAKLVPIDDAPIDYFGCMSGSVASQGDVISPIDEEWDAQSE